MKFSDTEIEGVKLIEPVVFGDHRGFFMETWQAQKFAAAGIDAPFVQDNHSRSAQGTLRGLHYQLPQAQGKLVRTIVGEIFDVAVDLRRGSPTFGKWAGFRLSAENKKMLWVPPGCGHGFYVTGDVAEIIYKCTDYYAPAHEHTIRWDDPDLGVAWPLAGDRPPLLSEKDGHGKSLRDAVLYP